MDEALKGISTIKAETEAMTTGSGVYSAYDKTAADVQRKKLEEMKKDFEAVMQSPEQPAEASVEPPKEASTEG
jgi:hypothetical protein